MAVLGISAGFHDAAVSVVDSRGKITFAGHAERYSKLKNDKDLNRAILEEAVSSTNETISAIGWYEKPWLKHTRQVYSGEKSLLSMPLSPRKYLRSIVGKDLDTVPIRTFGHHLTHAAAGFQTSNYGTAICVVVDAIGEWDCFSFWLAWYDDGKPQYKKLHSIKYPHSLGLFYSAITEACGLKPNEEEYITMGMAAFGNPHNWAARIVRESFDASHNEDNGILQFKSTLNFHAGMPDNIITPDMSKEDIAAAGQYAVETTIRKVFGYALNLSIHYGTNNFVYMGGVALNCKANTAVINRVINNPHTITTHNTRRLWTMPNPGDAGSSLGAAALLHGGPVKWENAFLGTNIPGKYPVRELVKILKSEAIVGVASGRAEFGPRALGNRSLLADPRGEHIKDDVNNIKRRQKYRPFSPVIMEEYVSDYFDCGLTPNFQYMQSLGILKSKYMNDFRAIMHVDGSARIQTVSKDDDSGMRDLLEQWYFWSGGCPMLLNTSLNIRGEPMVNDRIDADRFTQKYGVKVL